MTIQFGVVAMAVPKVGLDAENEEKTAEKLRVYKDSLSKEEIEKNCASHKGVKGISGNSKHERRA